MKLWGGRFNKELNEMVFNFNASLGFDKRLYPYDILGSIAHAEMLAKTGIISEEEGELLVKGLKALKRDLDSGKLDFDGACEDIHSFVESYLTTKLGPVGGKLHTARSRNDQVALDMRLYLRQEIKVIQELLCNFMGVILDLAKKHLRTYMPGYTHLQRAQAVTFAHHLLAYYFMLKRDYERLEDNLKRVNVLPLGAGALAGTTFPIDRNYVAQKLGFTAISKNSIDAVSDRDYLLEFLSIAATIILHLSRLSEEIILWAGSEFGFIELDDAYATGSSIMPQKKNPDIAELTRGKAGRIFGHLMQLLTTLKGLPLAYNKDLQEDKEGVFDTVDTLKTILVIYPEMLKTMKINKERMLAACLKGFLNATDLADYLAMKGLPFRKAHEVVGQAVLYCLAEGVELIQIPLEKWKKLFPELAEFFAEDLNSYLQIENSVNKRNSYGGTAPAENARIIAEEENWLKQQ